MFIVIFAILTFVTLSSAQDQTFVSCDIATLEKCHKKFVTRLGKPDLKWADYKNVRRLIESVYSNQKFDGLQDTCNAFDDFKKCFGTTEDEESFRRYQACTEDPLGLLLDSSHKLRSDVSLKSARGFVKIIAQFDFICGAGLSVFAENDDCMAQVFHNNRDELEKCQDEFDAAMLTDDANICVNQMLAADCYRKQFKICGLQSGWFGCEYERTGTEALYKQCTQNFCTVDTHNE